VLSVPTAEYLQASAWVPDALARARADSVRAAPGNASVRSGSTFFAGAHAPSSASAFTAFGTPSSSRALRSPVSPAPPTPPPSVRADAGDAEDADAIVDAAGARAAFVAGMIWALSRAVLPSAVHSPLPAMFPHARHGLAHPPPPPPPAPDARWRLDECLRYLRPAGVGTRMLMGRQVRGGTGWS
jgi:hypothetical protein